MPKISVITPTYDRLDMIGRAIESVLAQTFTDWEMIIVDDCPEKPAEEVVRQYADPRIIYIKHEKNSGGAAARNTAMARATGQYFAFIDDDDEWYPDALETLCGALAGTPDTVGFCFASIEQKYPDGRVHVTHVPNGIADYHERALIKFHGFIGQTLLVKRAVYEDIGGWDPAFPSHQEIEWVIRITKKYKALGIDRPVVRFFAGYDHPRIGNNLPKRIKGRQLLLDRYRSEFEALPVVYAKHLFLIALWYRALGDYTNARETLAHVIRLRPTPRHLVHYALLCFNGVPYRILSMLHLVGGKAHWDEG